MPAKVVLRSLLGNRIFRVSHADPVCRADVSPLAVRRQPFREDLKILPLQRLQVIQIDFGVGPILAFERIIGAGHPTLRFDPLIDCPISGDRPYGYFVGHVVFDRLPTDVLLGIAFDHWVLLNTLYIVGDGRSDAEQRHRTESKRQQGFSHDVPAFLRAIMFVTGRVLSEWRAQDHNILVCAPAPKGRSRTSVLGRFRSLVTVAGAASMRRSQFRGELCKR